LEESPPLLTSDDRNKFVIGVCDHVITTTGPEDLVLQSNPNPLNGSMTHMYSLWWSVPTDTLHSIFPVVPRLIPEYLLTKNLGNDHPNPDDCPNESKLDGAFAIKPKLQFHADYK